MVEEEVEGFEGFNGGFGFEVEGWFANIYHEQDSSYIDERLEMFCMTPMAARQSSYLMKAPSAYLLPSV